MAKYRFALKCWQDEAGDEDAKINVWIDGTQVATNAVVAATGPDSPTIVQLGELTGKADPDDSLSFAIKVVLANDLYIDESTDRNVYIDGVGCIFNINESEAYNKHDNADASKTTAVTDWADWTSYTGRMPSAVVSDDIPSYTINGIFHTVMVLGAEGGTTITVPGKPNFADG